MIGRDQYSAMRSLRRYIGLVLMDGQDPQNPWDVQFIRREPQQRPLAVVRLVGPRMSSGSAYVRDFEQQAEIFAYPAGLEGIPGTSEVEAQAVASRLLRALDTGWVSAGGYALRVPFFDYTLVAADAVLDSDAEPFDFLVLSNVSAEVQQDPETDDLYTVLVDLRLKWSDDGDTRRFEGAPLMNVIGKYKPRIAVGASRKIRYDLDG